MYSELERIVCPKCYENKFHIEFGKNATTARGISSWCKICKKKWRSQRRKEDPEYAKERDFKNDLKKHYGITPEIYYKMMKDQNDCCACCGQHVSSFRRGLHVDHDHDTHQVRALLCTQCNPGLGYFKHSVERLEMGIAYLNKFKN